MKGTGFALLCAAILIPALADSTQGRSQAAIETDMLREDAHSTMRSSSSRRLLAISLTCDFAGENGITCNSLDYCYCCGKISSGNSCSYQRGGFPNGGCIVTDTWPTPSCCTITASGSTGNAVAAGGRTANTSPAGSGSSGSGSSNLGSNLQSQRNTNSIVNTIAQGSGTPVNVQAVG